jgi:arylsulfatase
MSDHGEMLGDHGLYWKGAYFYEELVHVPLIISWPGKFSANLQSDALVELVDLAPTLLEAVGFEIPYYMQGKSLLSILNGTSDPGFHKKYVCSEFFNTLRGTHEGKYGSMYFDGRFKLVVFHGEDLGELYDLHCDPDEFENLWANPEYRDLKLELLKKSFDASEMIIDPKPPMIKYY